MDIALKMQYTNSFLQTKGKNKHLRLLLRKYTSDSDRNIPNLIKKGSFKKYKLATNNSHRIFVKDILNKWVNIIINTL